MSMSNRFSPSLQTLDARDVPAVITVSALPDGSNQVTVIGDNSSEQIFCRDFGNGTVHTFATGAGLVVTNNVTQIRIFANGGNDEVRYDLLADLQAGRKQDVAAWLDSSIPTVSGNDTFDARLWDGVSLQDRARLQIGCDGGFGSDRIMVQATNVDMKPSAWMKTNISGGAGNDVIGQVYSGEMDGSLALRTWGGDGDDTIREVMSFDAGSTGRIGALVYGGNGRDTQSLHVVNFQPGMTFDLLENHGDDDAGEVDALFSSGPVTNFP